jgi:glycosyltransferase involved in cell wall biosynthesis
MSFPQINIVIPLFNEEAVFDNLMKRLTSVIDSSEFVATVIMVDDGSRDNTAFLMEQQSLQDERFVSVILSRNFGHQYALTAGFTHVDATEAVFIIDGDLQDPPELLDEFFDQIKLGYDVVYAVREKRKENFFKKIAYRSFYRFLKRISYIDFPLDSGDFSLISRRVVDHLNSMPEESRFLRGMRSWIGFKQIGLPYERQKREAGESKYTFSKLLKLALNGIFNFSEYPIKFVSNMGVMTVILSLIYFIITVIKRFYFGSVPEGFTSLVLLIIFFGGVQLIAIGIIGEYVLRIFFQVKNRPLFIIKDVIKNKKRENG